MALTNIAGGGSGRPRVVYWNNMPAPYLVGRLNALERRANLDLEAWFNDRREPDRSWDVNESQWDFRARYIPVRKFREYDLQLPFVELRKLRPNLLLSLYASPSFALGTMAAKAAGCHTAFRVLPTYDSWVERGRGKEIAKHFLFRTVDAVETPGPEGGAFAARYGVPGNRIHPVTQSIDVKRYKTGAEIDPHARERRRAELGLKGCVYLYVGRLWTGKGLDYLFDAYRALDRERRDVSLLIVGDGVDEDKYRKIAAQMPSVVFAGFVQQPDLPSYYALADVFVFPTLGDPHGLVVEEAMAAGLPVISSSAAGDIRRRVVDGKTGYVVPAAESVLLKERMAQLASTPALRASMASEGRHLVLSRGHEQWAEDFENLVERTLAMAPRRNAATAAARMLGWLLVKSSHRRPDPLAPLIGQQDAL